MNRYKHRSRAEWLLVFFVAILTVPLLSYSTRSVDVLFSNTSATYDEVIETTGDNCSAENIVVNQAQTTPLPNGIPTYTVNILNECLSCSVSNVHLKCGEFSSARLLNPAIFRRIEVDDCLVKDGKTLGPGETVSFEYANTFRYPLTVRSKSCK